MRERIDYLNNLGQNRIHALKILKELTEVLPDTAWLSGLSVAGSKVEIQGYADYSTRLITGLEGSPLFANAYSRLVLKSAANERTGKN
jgi:general secretion pathway protein L